MFKAMFKAMISTRLSKPPDLPEIVDIDVKSFDLAWSTNDWYEILRDSYRGGSERIAVVATFYGNCIGFIVTNNGIVERLAVKQQFRRRGVATLLLQDAIERAKDAKRDSLTLIMPESFVYPDEQGRANPARAWSEAVGLKAESPFLKDHFSGYGETEDGVRFTIRFGA